MDKWLFVPPIAFGVILLALALLDVASRRLAPLGKASPGKTKAYACGEEPLSDRIQPSYGQFFPFAFFFTIMHVVTLILAMVPQGGLTNLAGLVALYPLTLISGLLILFGEKIERDLKNLFGSRS